VEGAEAHDKSGIKGRESWKAEPRSKFRNICGARFAENYCLGELLSEARSWMGLLIRLDFYREIAVELLDLDELDIYWYIFTSLTHQMFSHDSRFSIVYRGRNTVR
jgi:hypothetical protein